MFLTPLVNGLGTKSRSLFSEMELFQNRTTGLHSIPAAAPVDGTTGNLHLVAKELAGWRITGRLRTARKNLS
jgi:hypothetical protein